jgi:hypothetical protein
MRAITLVAFITIIAFVFTQTTFNGVTKTVGSPAEPSPRPTNIYSKSGVLRLNSIHNKTVGGDYSITIDAENHRIRVDLAYSQPIYPQEYVVVILSDFKNQNYYYFLIDVARQQKECMKFSSTTVDVFTVDMFKNATYSGITAYNGRIVQQWDNVLLPPFTPEKRETFATVYIDDFSHKVEGISRDGHNEYYEFSAGSVPEDLFTISSELLKLCN